MGYYVTITEQDFKCEKDISAELDEYLKSQKLYLPWEYGDGYVDLDEGYFKWDNEFLKDLLILRNLGVYGQLTCYGEEGEYYKYEIDDEGVKEYYGSVAFSEKPEKILKTEDDIKKFKF